MNWALYIWLGLMVVFLITEAVCAIHLVSIWFAAGAFVAMIAAALGAGLWLQVTLFLLVSGALLALLWPLARKHVKARVVATNADALVGKICKVTEAIDPLEGGRVKVGDVTWSARSENGDTIPAGEQVKILKIQGAKVIVEKVKKEVEV